MQEESCSKPYASQKGEFNWSAELSNYNGHFQKLETQSYWKSIDLKASFRFHLIILYLGIT